MTVTSLDNRIVHVYGQVTQSDWAANGFVIHKEKGNVFLVTDLIYSQSISGSILVNGCKVDFTRVIIDKDAGFSILRLSESVLTPLPFLLEIQNNTPVKISICRKKESGFWFHEMEGIIVAKREVIHNEWEIQFYESIPEQDLMHVHAVLRADNHMLIGFINVVREEGRKKVDFYSISYLKNVWLDFPENAQQLHENQVAEEPTSTIIERPYVEPLITIPSLYLPRNLVLEVMPDITTPGISQRQFMDSYLKVMDRKQVNELAKQHERSILAVENGDFLEFTKVADNIAGLESDIPEVAATATYLMGEGYRLIADETKNKKEAELLYKKAEDAYKLSISQNPNSSKPFRGLGAIYEKRPDYEKAHREYYMAFEIAQGKLTMISDKKKKLGAYHEMLRISRHLINNILKMRESSRQSSWNRPDKIGELIKRIHDCEQFHKMVMPLFRSRPIWYYFEWFAGWLFIAKAWADVDRPISKTNALMFALGNRKKMFRPGGQLTDIDKSNIEWWIRTYRYKTSPEEHFYEKQVFDLELSLKTEKIDCVIVKINAVLIYFPFII